jgi:Fur family ferric uptake transcriptional regulator
MIDNEYQSQYSQSNRLLDSHPPIVITVVRRKHRGLMVRKKPNNQTNQMQGRFLTTQRRLLLELLHDAEGHIDAKELYRRASAKDESIGSATVYRSLNLFKELGIVDERRLGKLRCYYEMKKSPGHQHLLCRGCGKVVEFQNPHLQKLIQALRREYGFKITKAELYLEGYCPECKEKEKRE